MADLDKYLLLTKFYAQDAFSSIDWSQPSLYISVASILFNPIWWNVVARMEYHNKTLTKLAGGNAKYGCYGLAVAIFSLGIIRDFLYERALNAQPLYAPLAAYPYTKPLAVALFLTGNILVLTSMYALGVTGTYLGDYFGILMDARVTGFPFNVTDNPMYWGSAMSFLGTALWYGRPAGVVLSVVVVVMYKIALAFEEPFTGAIYARRDAERKKAGAKAQ